MRVSVLFFVIGLSASTCAAQWVEADGPYTGGFITCFAVKGANIFAGTSAGGVYRSTDSGSSWSPTGSSPPDLNVRALAVIDSNLFAVTNTAGVFLSSDEGLHWTGVNDGLPHTSDHYSLTGPVAILGTNLYVCQNLWPYSNLYRSTDNGSHWSSVGPVLSTYTYIYCLGVSGSSLFAGIDGAGGASGLYLSTDNGASWKAAGDTLGGGVICFVANSNSLIVSTYHGLYHSTDNGASWSPVGNGLPSAYPYLGNVRCLASREANLFAGTTGCGVYLSTNNGDSWNEANSGLVGKDIYSLGICGTNLVAGTGCGLFISGDNGSSWTPVKGLSAFLSGYVSASALRGSELFVAARRGYGRGPYATTFFNSTDGGNSWIPEKDLDAFPSSLIVLGNDILVGTGSSGILHSPDKGVTWAAANQGLPKDTLDTSRCVCINCLASDGEHLFVGTYSGLFGSSDMGNSWISKCTGLSDSVITALLVAGANLYAGTDTAGVFLSTDGGK